MKIALNGFGRIGRNILRTYIENNNGPLQIIAINDLAKTETNSHLLKYDSIHGTLNDEVSHNDSSIFVNKFEIKCFSEKNPENLPWKELGVDLVFECTGLFTSKESAQAHLRAGAERVIISAPGSNVDKTVVFGVNHSSLNSNHKIISNASCTTNCLAPIAKIVNDNFKIKNGLVNTIHSYTNDQKLLDTAHVDLFRARSATESLIPTKTGAASAVGEVIPELQGKMDGLAIRVPTPNVSLLDFTFNTSKEFTIDELNQIIKQSSKQKMKGIVDVNSVPLISVDFKGNPHSCVYDKQHTQKIGSSTKILAWYDNEWGFSNRMKDLATYIQNTFHKQIIAA